MDLEEYLLALVEEAAFHPVARYRLRNARTEQRLFAGCLALVKSIA